MPTQPRLSLPEIKILLPVQGADSRSPSSHRKKGLGAHNAMGSSRLVQENVLVNLLRIRSPNKKSQYFMSSIPVEVNFVTFQSAARSADWAWPRMPASVRVVQTWICRLRTNSFPE